MAANTTGYYNVGEGSNTLRNNTTGIQNTAIGRAALNNSTTGNGNIAIGHLAGTGLTTGGSNIYLGNQGANDSNAMRLGGASQIQTFIAGIVDGPVANPATVTINTATGELGIASSSARYKKDISDLDDQAAKLDKLRPVRFAYKSDATNTTQYGLVAEEVAQVYPELVAKNAKGQVETVEYQALIPILLAQIQKQQDVNENLMREVASLTVRLDQLQAQIDTPRHLASRR
jgi:hypothetical protein